MCERGGELIVEVSASLEREHVGVMRRLVVAGGEIDASKVRKHDGFVDSISSLPIGRGRLAENGPRLRVAACGSKKGP